MAFKAVFLDATLFRDAVRAINDLIAEGIFRFTSDGLKFVATDPTMVAMVDLYISKDAFEELNVEGEEEQIPVNLDNLLAVLKRAKKADRLILEKEQENRLAVVLESSVKRKFVIPLIDMEEQKVPELNLQFLGTAEVLRQVVEEGITDAAVVSDTIMFSMDQDKFVMTGEGDLSKAEVVVEKGSEALISLDVKEPAKSKFSLDYLKKMIKGMKLGDLVKISLGNDFPMEMEIKAGELAKLKYVLAPRVEG